MELPRLISEIILRGRRMWMPRCGGVDKTKGREQNEHVQRTSRLSNISEKTNVWRQDEKTSPET